MNFVHGTLPPGAGRAPWFLRTYGEAVEHVALELPTSTPRVCREEAWPQVRFGEDEPMHDTVTNFIKQERRGFTRRLSVDRASEVRVVKARPSRKGETETIAFRCAVAPILARTSEPSDAIEPRATIWWSHTRSAVRLTTGAEPMTDELITRPQPSRAYRWIVLLSMSVAVYGSYYALRLIGPLAPLLSRQLQFTDANIGLLQAVYSFPNIVMVLIGGIIIDRIGTKKSFFCSPSFASSAS